MSYKTTSKDHGEFTFPKGFHSDKTKLKTMGPVTKERLAAFEKSVAEVGLTEAYEKDKASPEPFVTYDMDPLALR
jgi:hypothetical protein